jgi:hypothetical protein
MRAVWILLIPMFCAEVALRSPVVWITKTLLICAGFVGSGLLLPTGARKIAFPLARVVAVLSGGLLTLAASSLSVSSPSSRAEIGPCVLALLVAGAAALCGQLMDQRDRGRYEAALLSRIARLEAAHVESHRRTAQRHGGRVESQGRETS